MTSQVVPFRLNDDIPDERRVLEILQAGIDNGWTYREMLVRAVLSLDGQQFPPRPEDNLAAIVNQLAEALNKVEAMVNSQTLPQLPANDKIELAQNFVQSVVRGAKKGRSYNGLAVAK